MGCICIEDLQSLIQPPRPSAPSPPGSQWKQWLDYRRRAATHDQPFGSNSADWFGCVVVAKARPSSHHCTSDRSLASLSSTPPRLSLLSLLQVPARTSLSLVLLLFSCVPFRCGVGFYLCFPGRLVCCLSGTYTLVLSIFISSWRAGLHRIASHRLASPRVMPPCCVQNMHPT
jgi:hypothetical protein